MKVLLKPWIVFLMIMCFFIFLILHLIYGDRYTSKYHFILQKYYLPDSYFGEYKRDKDYSGLEIDYEKNGNILIKANYLNGLIHGEFLSFKNGIRNYSSSYLKGVIDGQEKIYSDNGEIVWIESSYKMGVLEGVVRFYYKSGKLKRESNFMKGAEMDEIKEWYESGKIKAKLNKGLGYAKFDEVVYAFDFANTEDKEKYIVRAISNYYDWNQVEKYNFVKEHDLSELIYSVKRDRDRLLLPSVLLEPPYHDYGVDTLMLDLEHKDGILFRFGFYSPDDTFGKFDCDKGDLNILRDEENDLFCVSFVTIKNKTGLTKEMLDQKSIEGDALYFSYFSGKQIEYNEDGSTKSIQMYGETGEFLFVEYYEKGKVVEKYIGKDSMLLKVELK